MMAWRVASTQSRNSTPNSWNFISSFQRDQRTSPVDADVFTGADELEVEADDGADGEALVALDAGPAEGQVPGIRIDGAAGQHSLAAGGGLDDDLVPLLEPSVLAAFFVHMGSPVLDLRQGSPPF